MGIKEDTMHVAAMPGTYHSETHILMTLGAHPITREFAACPGNRVS
jgi:hypothetical protein